MFFIVMFFGTMFSLSSPHWLGVWAGLEINLIGFLPILVYQKSMLESESAVKYFIIQAMGSSFLIFGSLFGYSLTFSWESLGFVFASGFMGSIFLGLGLLLKMGVFPFHFWFPSVMAGLSWFSCLLLATWQKVAPAFLMLAVLDASLVYSVFLLFCLLGAGSSLVGGIGGLNQTQIRALLAYSSIGHMGWILFASCYGESSMKIYFSIYVVISICIFVSLWALDSGSLVDVSSAGKSDSKAAFSFMVMLLSLGGLPPLLGFISKWTVISSSVTASPWGVLFFLVLGSLMSLFYYLSLFFSEVLSLKVKFLNSFTLDTWEVNNYVSFAILVNLLGGIMLVLLLPSMFL
uniref:NADH-ubiquinone oxidoreductase chain 2 n=1 Tax=Cerithidea obtusa TaxID=496816 RepID=A0A3G3G560_9CAEN|nr:NADH dehydrogenase subunit 2 [Cerithidea obtusa]AYQ21837.1 NADH dehydrogenase subunit 2 [Cerithidea obtusa]